jgi:hypothetical protein
MKKMTRVTMKAVNAIYNEYGYEFVKNTEGKPYYYASPLSIYAPQLEESVMDVCQLNAKDLCSWENDLKSQIVKVIEGIQNVEFDRLWIMLPKVRKLFEKHGEWLMVCDGCGVESSTLWGWTDKESNDHWDYCRTCTEKRQRGYKHAYFQNTFIDLHRGLYEKRQERLKESRPKCDQCKKQKKIFKTSKSTGNWCQDCYIKKHLAKKHRYHSAMWYIPEQNLRSSNFDGEAWSLLELFGLIYQFWLFDETGKEVLTGYSTQRQNYEVLRFADWYANAVEIKY